MIAVKNTVVPRLFDLLPKYEQDRIKHHVMAVIALAEQRKQPEPERITVVATMSPKKVSAAQHAAFYSQLNTHKQRTEESKPGPKAEPKLNRKDKRPLVPPAPPNVYHLIRNLLLEHGPLTNREIVEKLGWQNKPDAHKRISTRTNTMLSRGEIVKHGEVEQNSRVVHIYAAVKDWRPGNTHAKPKSSNILAVAEWLRENGAATTDEIAAFLQCKSIFAQSVMARMCQYKMAHRVGYSEVKKRNNRPMILFAAGPEPEKDKDKDKE